MDLFEVDESDCCGNGCANCILDIKKTLSNKIEIKKFDQKINCLHTNNFYEVIFSKYVVDSDVLQLKFQLKYQQDTTSKTENPNQIEKSNLILSVPPGHHVMMKTNSYRRPYTPCWIDSENCQFEILVNLRPNGIMSKYIRQLKLNDLVQFKGPIGTFYHEINKYEHLLIFSNGIAVSSVIPIIEGILNNEEDMTRIYYFGCFVNFKNIYFRENFSNYNQYWNFNGKIYMAREKCQKEECILLDNINNKSIHNDGCCKHLKEKIKYGEKIYNYKLSNEEILQYLKGINLDKMKIVICGSKVFENFIKDCLENLKINKENVNVL